MITVLNPQGIPSVVAPKTMARRPDSLDGKTVCLVDVRFNDGDVLLEQMQAWFADHMPAVKTLFYRKSGIYTFDDQELWQEVKKRGDAVVVGGETNGYWRIMGGKCRKSVSVDAWR